MKDIEQLYENLIKSLGEDPEREGLLNTPRRASRALMDFTRGYSQDVSQVVNGALFETEADDMVAVKNIEFYSLCEHHLLPFFGKVHVGYIPNGKIIGVSKIPRIVDVFARRFQVQENLTREVAQSVMEVTGASGVGVIIEARHLCMMMRGVEKQNSAMKTSAMLGNFREDAACRAEFLKLVLE